MTSVGLQMTFCLSRLDDMFYQSGDLGDLSNVVDPVLNLREGKR